MKGNRKGELPGRFRWLLEEMSRKQGFDVQEIDRSLTYWENKRIVEKKYHTALVLKPSRLDEERLRRRLLF